MVVKAVRGAGPPARYAGGTGHGTTTVTVAGGV